MLFRNYEVWIAHDGVALPEFTSTIPRAQDPSAHMATAYLLSENDKVFSVNWRNLAPENIVSITVRMDDVLVNQMIAMPGADSGQLCGVVSGPAFIRPFAFTNVPRLQTRLASADDLVRRDFGTIRVTFVPLRYVQSSLAPTVTGGPLSSNISPSPLFDTHCICLHDERRLVGQGSHSHVIPVTPPVDIEATNDEAIVFEFRYGPLVCLQHIGVVPPRTVVFEGDLENVLPLTSGLSMLGKRSRSQYEDVVSLSDELKVDMGEPGATSDKADRTFIICRRIRGEVAEGATTGA